MVLKELIKELQGLVAVHPEAAEHMVEFTSFADNYRTQVHYVGWDKKRKCIKLEDA